MRPIFWLAWIFAGEANSTDTEGGHTFTVLLQVLELLWVVNGPAMH